MPPTAPSATESRRARDAARAVRYGSADAAARWKTLRMQSVLDYGMTLIGTPYVWGGTNPRSGLDCSGLVQAVYAKFGVKLPRVSRDQARVGTAVSPSSARPGDLIAFDNSSARAGVDHIGIYLGNGKMLVAPRTGSTVQVQSVNLARAATIRRVGNADYSGLKRSGTSYYYNTSGHPTHAGGSATGDRGLTSANNRAMDAHDLATSYGYIYSFLQSDHELRRLFDKAQREGWSAARFEAGLRGTKWFKRHSESDRAWIVKKQSDPATAARDIERAVATIANLALETGVKLNGKRMRKMAEDSLRFGWSDAELRRFVRAEVSYNAKAKGFAGGEAQTTFEAIKALSRNYGVPMSDAKAAAYTDRIFEGRYDLKAVEAEIKTRAKSMYPGITKEIDRGLTVRDVADPYLSLMAQTLELAPDSVEVDDPLIRRMLQARTKDGKGTLMPLWQAERLLRGDKRFGTTKAAVNEGYAVGRRVLQDFGFGI